MKKIMIRFGMAIITAITVTGLWSCSDEVIADNDIQKPSDKVEVKINLGGEITPDITDMTRADEDNADLYGVTISFGRYDDFTDNDHQYVAYGLFDEAHKNDIKVILDNYTSYNICATKIVGGKDLIRIDEGNPNYYADPMYFPVDSINTFIYDKDLWSSFQWGEGYYDYGEDGEDSEDDNAYLCNYDRYYGEVLDYKPSEDGEINIKMLRVVFGLKINVNNLAEGDTLVVSSTAMEDEAPWMYEYDGLYPITLVGNASGEASYEGLNVIACNLSAYYKAVVSDTDPAMKFYFSLKWIGKDGIEKDLSSNMQEFSVEFQRLKAYTVNIDIPKYETKSATVTLEETEFTDENYTLDSTNGLTPQSATSGE